MKKIEAIIQPFKLPDVKDALIGIGVNGMTVTDVRGHGRQKGHTGTYRGAEYNVDLIAKIKVEIVAADWRVEEIRTVLRDAAKTGNIGDGKIFISSVNEAIRIRNGERGEEVL